MNKKLILGLVMAVMLGGCSILEDEGKPKKEAVQQKLEQDYVDPYLDDNPIELGLYINDGGTRNLVSTYTEDFVKNIDIVSLEVYYTKEETISGNQKKIWNDYYQNYEDIDGYKIGYYISFMVGDDEISQRILKPSDGNSIYDYVQIYLYDDINQGDGFYIHITDEEMVDDSILSSIKLTGSTKSDEITGSIKVMAFTYDGDNDFDGDGLYRGNSSYEVVINEN